MKGDIYIDWVVDDEYFEGNENDDDVKEFERWVFLILLLFGMVLENM